MSVIDLSGYFTYWPFRTAQQVTDETLGQAVSPTQAYTNQNLIKTAIEALDDALVIRDGRSISEVVSDPDAATEFVAGGTFTVNPANPRHSYLKIGDSSTPLTANMTVDLNASAAGRVAGHMVTVVKGDTSAYTVTVSGFDADGLGTYVLKRYRDSIECIVQTTDSNNGPGPGGVKFERGIQTRPNPDSSDVAFDAGESGASGATVQAAVRDAGDRIEALEGGSGSIGTLSTANETAKTSAFNLTTANASTYIDGSVLKDGIIIPVDTSGGAVVATMVGTISDLPGKTWLINVIDNTSGCTVQRPQTWEFSRTGDTDSVTNPDIVTNIDISGILDGMAVAGSDDELPGGTTVADADYDTDKIQLSAGADETQVSATLIFQAGEVGTINGVEDDFVLREGLNIIHCISADETTGVTVITAAVTQGLEIGSVVTTSRDVTRADFFKVIPLNHATVAVDLTVPEALSLAAPEGAWFVIHRLGAAASSALGAGPPTMSSPDGFTEETALGQMTLVYRYSSTQWYRSGGLEAS